MKAEEYIDMKEAAIEEWSQNICSSINNARNIKDKWSEFKKFTKRNENNVILPFIQQNNDVIFEENEKAVELEQTFFKGKHLNTDKFDENFYNEALRQYTEITLNQDATDEEVYNTEIELEELEGAIDRLKKDSAPGPEFFYRVNNQCGQKCFDNTTLHIQQELERRQAARAVEKSKHKIPQKTR